jgi:hypothetical protein
MAEVHPPTPMLVHQLPPAPYFVGREVELSALRQASRSQFRGVLALVGLGGAGKTAIGARFLEELLKSGGESNFQGLFVWSFYQEPDAGLFLEQAYDYFNPGGQSIPAKGAGLLHLLGEALEAGGPHLLVLDGLERVQLQESTGAYGRVDDPLLRAFLIRIAEGLGKTKAIITSRFPLTDLESMPGEGYQSLPVGGLDQTAAQSLLRQRGVKGDEEALTALIETYGAHALTLDHLGGLLGQFLEGDPGRAPELPSLTSKSGDRQALRLARLLRAYEEHLPAAELALLCRLCLLRRSVTTDQIGQLFLCQPEVHARTVRELPELIQGCLASRQSGDPDHVRDLAKTIQETVAELLSKAPIAGPEEPFRQEMVLIAETVFQTRKFPMDFTELARLYAGKNLDPPSASLPLSLSNREDLAYFHDRFIELRQHPDMPYKESPSELEELISGKGTVKEPPEVLEKSFLELGFGKKQRRAVGEEAASVLRAFVRVQDRLRLLAVMHIALGRVRELCRLLQRKWSLAGCLTPLDLSGMRQVLDGLVNRHLVLREANGSFSVHPAVRDHFYRVATTAESGSWHDILRQQLITLAKRPGHSLPEDSTSLDLVEEAIYHALEAGRHKEAQDLYQNVLGGLRHLAWKLGEMARGLRILRQFQPCPDPWSLAWFLRALGEFKEAYLHNNFPYFRADILLLQGRLPRVAAEREDTRTAIAAFLMGKTTALPSQPLGAAIPRDQLFLYSGRFSKIQQLNLLDDFYHEIGWEGDRARCLLIMAETAARQGDGQLGRKHLEAASRWILHSGSVEHLCLMQLVKSRMERLAGENIMGQRAVEEGLKLALQCGLGLYLIELLCEQAQVLLVQYQAAQAESAAREAWRLASDADCQFAWGAAEAGQILGQALYAKQEFTEARSVLIETLELRRRIGHPKIIETQRLLEQVSNL